MDVLSEPPIMYDDLSWMEIFCLAVLLGVMWAISEMEQRGKRTK